jgi:site-specific DNA recombinase
MFDTYKRTRSRTRVRQELEIRGAKTRKGESFSKGAVEVILTNPIYAGKIFENSQIFDGIHEAIIDEDTFFALNSMNLLNIHDRKQKTDRVYLLKGIVKCGHHSCRMTPYYVQKKNKKLIYYYRCTKYVQYRHFRCPSSSVNADRLEGYVVERLKQISKEESLLESIIDQVNLDLETEKEPYRKEMVGINERKSELNKQVEHFMEAVAESGRKAVNELFEKRIEKLQQQLAELEKKKGDLTLLLAKSPNEIDSELILERLKDFSHMYDSLSNQEKATLLQSIIQEVKVYKDNPQC